MGYTALAAAIQYAVTNAKLAFTAQYVPPESDMVDGEIELRPKAGGLAEIALQVGPYGGSLNRYGRDRDGEITNIAMVKQYERLAATEVCTDIVAELKARS